MPQPIPAQPAWWTSLNLALIVCTALLLLCPPLRDLPAFKWSFSLGLVPAYCIAQLWQLKTDGTARLTVGQIYQQARAGRRLSSALDKAAFVAFVLAMLYLH